jgi:hypothetical protein
MRAVVAVAAEVLAYESLVGPALEGGRPADDGSVRERGKS